MKKYFHSKLFCIVLLFSLLAGCGVQKEVVELKFTSELVLADLDKMQANMNSQGIKLTHEFLQFDESGRLKQITASIEYADGERGSFESGILKPGDTPGFYRDFSKE